MLYETPTEHDDVEIGAALVTGAKAVADKAKQYAPVAAAVAEQAKAKAGNIALHSRIATQTGLHPVGVISFCSFLLIASIALPVVLAWPLTLTISARNDLDEMNGGMQNQQQLQGATIETKHSYDGTESVIDFVPARLTDPRKSRIVMATLLCGPILISGSPVLLSGRGKNSEGGTAVGSVVMSLSNNMIFWLSALALLILLVIADLLIGDIYAMQKLLISLILVWVGYCLLLGIASESALSEIAAQFFPETQLEMTIGGLMTSPLKIGFIGLIYWMISVLLRGLYQERTAAAQRRKASAEA
ncbi:MAG: hypothetical protein M3R04_00535 [bacterium]|nr:hypothetical protein [bacterium]